MAIPFSRFTHSPSARWRGRLKHGPQLLIPLLVLDITIMVLIAATMIYSATGLKRYGSQTIGMYWDNSVSENASQVFLYLAVPLIDLFHLLAQATAFLLSPSSNSTTGTDLSLLHPAAALSGALVAFCLWAYQLSIATAMDLVGWEQPRDGVWNGLAAARCVVAVAIALLWALDVGFAAAAVHCWRREKKAKARNENERGGRAQQGSEEGLESGTTMAGYKVSGETMVGVGLEDGVGRKGGLRREKPFISGFVLKVK